MNSNILSLLAGLALTAHAALPIPNHAAADLVLGQVDFTSRLNPGPPNAASLDSPESIVIDPVTRKVFVSDYGNSRILRYTSADALANGAAAEAVFGNDILNSVAPPGAALNRIGGPVGLFLDFKGRLWVADFYHNRVLMFSAAVYRDSGASADRVFGQPDFTTTSTSPTQAKIKSPYDVCVDSSDRLWVADSSHNRVLRFDNISNKSSGANADGVLGHANFTTASVGSGTSGLHEPTGVTIGGNGALYVTCSNGSRVLRFDNAAGLGNNAPAAAVLGQPDFATTTSGNTAAKMANPYGCWITPDDSLWVTDYGNNRLLRFNNASTKLNGASADGVLGQPDFTTKLPSTTRRGLRSPYIKPFVDTKGCLWISDNDNHRILRFSPPAPIVVADKTAPLLVISTKVPKMTTKAQFLLKGTARDASGIKSVQYRLGKAAPKNAKGTTSWKIKANLKKGVNTLSLIATDSAGNVSKNKIIKITRK
jgi:sugar lactone lactonase YvrE